MEIEGFKDEEEFVNIAEEVLSILETKKTLILCHHTLIDKFELHIDSIIKTYKKMTITLLMGIVAAIGFIYSVELQGFQVDKLIATSLIFLFGMLGVFSIWVLDIQVFHRFWGAFFIEEVKMEKKYPFLIDIGDVAASLDNIEARIQENGIFYTRVNTFLILVSGVTASFLFQSYWAKGGILLFTGTCIWILIKIMNDIYKKIKKSVDDLFNRNKVYK